MNRIKEGFVDVRNPFNKKLVSRIYFEDVDLILFCTKNPIPILDKIENELKELCRLYGNPSNPSEYFLVKLIARIV